MDVSDIKYGDFSCFIPLLEEGFWGVVASKNSYPFYGEKNIFDVAVDYFKGQNLELEADRLIKKITFDNGANIIFTLCENTCGMKLGAALILESHDITEREILYVVSRVRGVSDAANKVWLKKV